MRVAVFFSGRGSNFENIVKMLHKKEVDGMQIEICAALCNKKEALGIKLSERLGIPCTLLESSNFENREAFDTALVNFVRANSVDLVVLAGFMRILTPIFTSAVKAVNIHPSLLPQFKGANAIEKTFESGAKIGGVTAHWVNDELDGGEIIDQKSVPILSGDTLQTYETRIHEAEYILYPQAIVKALKTLSDKA